MSKEGLLEEVSIEELKDIFKESIRALQNSINSNNPAQLSCQVARNKLMDLYTKLFGENWSK